MHLNLTFLSFGSLIHSHLILTLGYLKARLEGCMSFKGAQRFVLRKNHVLKKTHQPLRRSWNMSWEISLYHLRFVLILCLAFLVVLQFELCAAFRKLKPKLYTSTTPLYHGKKIFDLVQRKKNFVKMHWSAWGQCPSENI